MREGNADEPLGGSRPAVQADGAAVRGIADAHRGHAGAFGEVYRQRVGPMGHHDALPLAAMHLSSARAGALDSDVGARLDGPVRDPVQIVRQARDAVRIDPPKAGLGQALGQAARVRLGEILG
ncbi:hypothetical protein D3C72_1680070 [compost metagenome]